MGTKRKSEGEETAKKVKKPAMDHWSLGLLSAMRDPNLKVEEDDQVVVIKDKYPKAQFHFLVIPKKEISSLETLQPEDVELLKHMHKVGKKLAKKQPDSTFKIGYHAHASMSQLHLHVISDDFNSVGLKSKKHWNSYTTDFFLPYGDVFKQLKADGKVTMKSEEECSLLLGHALKCHKCKFMTETIPKLKKHLQVTHSKAKKREEEEDE